MLHSHPRKCLFITKDPEVDLSNPSATHWICFLSIQVCLILNFRVVSHGQKKKTHTHTKNSWLTKFFSFWTVVLDLFSHSVNLIAWLWWNPVTCTFHNHRSLMTKICNDCLHLINWAVYAKSLQMCPTPCDPMDCSPPGSTVHGIL